MKLKPTAMAIAAEAELNHFPNDPYAHTPDFRSCRPYLPIRARVARQACTEMINGFSTCIEMKKQRKNSKTRPDERPNQIEVSFAEPERPRRIPLIINAT